MNEDSNLLAEAFRRQLAGQFTPDAIRRIEDGASPDPLWRELEDSGFVDALVPEAAGGAGLTLADAFPLVLAAGEYGVPLPFAETMIARGLLAVHGLPIPPGAPIALAVGAPSIPGARFASHALIDRGGAATLVTASATGSDIFGTGAAIAIDEGEAIASVPGEADAVLLAAAAVTAALMAGAFGRVLDMSLDYAGQRQQFGRSLGKFQAIQQQLAVLAEQVISAQVAARNAFVGTAFDPVRVAAAKCRANEAGALVCNIAHAVHGAIGVTAEFDLQLYTRRIKQGQLAYGSESFWALRLGRARLASGARISADFLREHLASQPA